MSDKSPSERIAFLESADQYERQALLTMQKRMESLHAKMDDLERWKRDCDQMSRVWLRVAMAFSLIATSLGVWLDNVKSLLKSLFAWVGS